MSSLDEIYMALALKQAKKAADQGEVPVGCVIVKDGRVIARGYNRRETRKDPLQHAEVVAIRRAAKKLRGWRLIGCRMYVTLEPCPMCAGAIVNARLPELVFGAFDPKAGCFGSVQDFNSLPFNHHPSVTAGVLQGECASLLKDFFADKRKGKR